MEKSFREQAKAGPTHLVSIENLLPSDVDYIMKLSQYFKQSIEQGTVFDLAKGKILVNLFYEPSTRTSCSFQAAMMRLGGSTMVVDDMTTSSISKGESLEDTVRCLTSYADAIVLRHPQKGAVQQASTVSEIPMLNAGDGVGEHPTQALLDLFTLISEIGDLRTEPKHVAMVGDLKHGRTVHSLTKLLSLFPLTSISFVSPDSLAMPEDIITSSEMRREKRFLSLFSNVSHEQPHEQQQGVYSTNTNLEQCIPKADALYVTRVQKERFPSEEEYLKVRDEFILSKSTLENNNAKSSLRILHPLPRVNEISTDLDDTPAAAYFRQMKNGLYVRMAVLAIVLRIDGLIETKLE